MNLLRTYNNNEDYSFTLPVPGVQPVSQGIPTKYPPDLYDANGAAHDRQWELMKTNFCGKWCGNMHWFKRSKNENDNEGNSDRISLQDFISILENNSELPCEYTQLIENTQYYI